MALLGSPALSASPHWSMYDMSNTNQEHDLFESAIVESCDIFGFEVYYYAINPSFDHIYGEDQNLKYFPPVLTKMVYKPGEEPMLYGQWGMISDEMIEKLRIPKFTFSRDISGADHPEVGDAVRVPWNVSHANPQQIIYEVTDVDEEDDIFQGKKFSWELTVKPFRASEDNNEVDQSGELDSVPISAFGDNELLETEGDKIDDYDDLPSIEKLYGFN